MQHILQIVPKDRGKAATDMDAIESSRIIIISSIWYVQIHFYVSSKIPMKSARNFTGAYSKLSDLIRRRRLELLTQYSLSKQQKNQHIKPAPQSKSYVSPLQFSLYLTIYRKRSFILSNNCTSDLTLARFI